MARTMADIALLFETVSGPALDDPHGSPVPLRPCSPEAAREIPIGYFEDDGHVPVTQETRQAVQAAAQALQRRGFTVRPFRPRGLEEARRLWWKFFVRGGAMFVRAAIAGAHEPISPILQEFLSIAAQEPPLTGDELLNAWFECDAARQRLLHQMRDFPILICPACAIPAFGHGERAWDIDGVTVNYLDAMRYTQWFNLLAAPAAVVPVGQSQTGLPIGVQIAGRPYQDEQVIAIASVVDQEFGYQPPPLVAPNAPPDT
jgi:Asp-tRNA(Asn)/Glu-tRNA(Gln) amidotransferase A subunit family amidase